MCHIVKSLSARTATIIKEEKQEEEEEEEVVDLSEAQLMEANGALPALTFCSSVPASTERD
jgi:hypothetical protein